MVILLILTSAQHLSAKIHMSKQEFLNLISAQDVSFRASDFRTKTLWLDKNTQKEIKNILNHKYPKLRLRYETSQKITQNTGTDSPLNHTTVWFLDEIGKERPISFAVAVKNNRIRAIRVLEFRESRGYEIKLPAFAQQFKQIGVDQNGRLDHNIDGITGATMSVRAMKKISRVALMLHKKVLVVQSSEPINSDEQE